MISPAKNKGRLFVFEGPDGFGKTTLANELTAQLTRDEVACRLFSFPGREAGSLGALVYTLHHNPKECGVAAVDPTSLQVLHLAAHIDNVHSLVSPCIEAGVSVVLDRFWWSLAAYGAALGADRFILDHAIDIERHLFRAIQPDCIFLVNRASRFRMKSFSEQEIEKAVLIQYDSLAKDTKESLVVCVTNVGDKTNVLSRAWEAYREGQGQK